MSSCAGAVGEDLIAELISIILVVKSAMEFSLTALAMELSWCTTGLAFSASISTTTSSFDLDDDGEELLAFSLIVDVVITNVIHALAIST